MGSFFKVSLILLLFVPCLSSAGEKQRSKKGSPAPFSEESKQARKAQSSKALAQRAAVYSAIGVAQGLECGIYSLAGAIQSIAQEPPEKQKHRQKISAEIKHCAPAVGKRLTKGLEAGWILAGREISKMTARQDKAQGAIAVASDERGGEIASSGYAD